MSSWAPYISTSPETVYRMLEMAETGPDDIVYDLGCGDARILITAVEEFGVKKAVGYEIRSDVYKTALSIIESSGLEGKVKVINGDLFKADISEATVITLYLTSSANKRLKLKLEREARLGTRIVSHDFEIWGWRKAETVAFHSDTLYLYRIPEAFKFGWERTLGCRALTHRGYLAV